MAIARGVLFACLLISASALHATTVQQGLALFKQGDYRGAHDVWLPLSEAGDPRATFYLSRLYAQGKGVPQNPRVALQYLTSAAEFGDPLAQLNLGNRHYRGDMVEQDPVLARKWWMAAATRDIPQAQHNLGLLYLRGEGVQQDPALAWYWFDRATKNGFTGSRKLRTKLEAPVTTGIAGTAAKDSPRLTGKNPPAGTGATGAAARQQKRMEPEKQPPTASSATALGDRWILEQPRDMYTLQLIASESAAVVARLRERYEWVRPVSTYTIASNEQTLTALSYGLFKDAAAARAAIEELPAELRRGKPWPRRLADIHASTR